MRGVNMLNSMCIVSCTSLRIYSKIREMEDRMTRGIVIAINCCLMILETISSVTLFLPSEKVKQSFCD